jgi:hypothetical protein
MKSIKIARRFVVALLAVFMLLGAMVASVAQAETEPTRAPVWTVNKTILGENVTKELTAKATENLVLTGAAVTVTCEEGNLAKGSFIANEGGANGQAITVSTAEFKKCKVTGNGTKCTKVKEPIVTKPIRSEFVLNDLEPGIGNKILVEFDPRSGKEFVELRFEGEECKFANTEVTELVIALLWNDPATKELELGEPLEEKSYIIKFPDEPKSVYLWSLANKKFELFTPTLLKAFTEKVKLTGQLLILLATNGVSNEEPFGLTDK